MSAHTQAHGSGHGHDHGHERHYVKIWAILLVLLIISVVGPFVGSALKMQWITLLTAFGIAAVKAYMVAKNFMHIDVEKPIIRWIMVTGVALMVLLYGALAPDIQKGEGQNWKKDAGFHHSFTTSKPHHAGGDHAEGTHSEAAPAEGAPAEGAGH
jgi:caa(3)-type oxidase subunit IV